MASQSRVVLAPARSGLSPRAKELRRLGVGLAFAAPWIIGLCVFLVYPIAASLYYSFTEYSVLEEPVWIGLQNYGDLFLRDALFVTAISNTAIYALMAIPLGTVFAIALALLLNLRVRFQAVHRTIFYLPVLVPTVALALVWQWVLNPSYGIVNAILDAVGIVGPGWYASELWAKPSYVLMSLWVVGNAVVIYLAGLQDVPRDLYDAAAVDGANAWHRLRNVTLPMISPVIFFNVILGLIGAMQVFSEPYIITGGTGNPANAAMFYVLLLYRNAFVYFKMGYASAMAWVLFAIVLVITLLLVRGSRSLVYYSGDERR
jgi:multiple sugar transport system permease protein